MFSFAESSLLATVELLLSIPSRKSSNTDVQSYMYMYMYTYIYMLYTYTYGTVRWVTTRHLNGPGRGVVYDT